MKIIGCIVIAISLTAIAPAWSNETSVEKAYFLYYQGEKDAAINMMEDYIRDNPDPKAYYFLGYAYYEQKDMDRAREFFNEAYRLKSFYSPVTPGQSQ